MILTAKQRQHSLCWGVQDTDRRMVAALAHNHGRGRLGAARYWRRRCERLMRRNLRRAA